MAKPTYTTFKKDIFPLLSQQEINELFYWSLIDYSSWEEGLEPDFMPDYKRGRIRCLSILKRVNGDLKDLINKNPDKFYTKFMQSELLTNYLLGAGLEKELKKRKKLLAEKSSYR